MTRKYDTLEGMYVYVYSCTTTLYESTFVHVYGNLFFQ